jgi:hypothetical protein
VENDNLSAALAIPGLPDLSSAVRLFMLGDGPKLSMEGIKSLSDQAVLGQDSRGIKAAAEIALEQGAACRKRQIDKIL